MLSNTEVPGACIISGIPFPTPSKSTSSMAIRYKHHQQALNIAVTILHHLKTPWLKKTQFTKYVDILKCEIQTFTFIHSNFE